MAWYGIRNRVYLPFLLPLLFRFQGVAHLGAARQVLYAAAHVCLVAFKAGLMIGGLESDSPRFVGCRVTLPAGLELAGDRVLFEDGRVDPMAFRARLNHHRAVLMVAVGASARRGDVPRMVEPHRFVDVGQAPQNEILRNVLPRGRIACGGDSDPECDGHHDDRRFLHGCGLLRSGISSGVPYSFLLILLSTLNLLSPDKRV